MAILTGNDIYKVIDNVMDNVIDDILCIREANSQPRFATESKEI